jgi:Cysteine-rich secretory protein family
MRLATTRAAISAAILVFSLAAARAQEPGLAQALFESANQARAAQGLAALKWSATVAAAARQHALRMAARNMLSHQLPGEPGMADRASQAGARFSALAENVAEGPSARSIHEQWMNSPPHRANLLDAQLDTVGIGVAERNGVLFAVEDFSTAAGQLSLTQQEAVVDRELQSQGLHLLNYTRAARRSCVLDNGYAGSHVPSFVLHYATPDLGALPDLLEQRIRSGKYRSAVVGACPSDAKIGSSNYRIAVLLYE